MKKSILIAVAIIGIVSCCASVSAENVVDLGTLNYDDGYEFILYVNINSTQAVYLQFITSEMNENDLGVINNGFYPAENKTLYRFVANKITPDFWFTPEIVEYYFIDNNTKQVYRLSVNYSNADVPENPYKLLYDDMEIEYNEAFQELTNISIQLTNITGRYNQTRTELNAKLIELANLHESFNTNQDEWQRRHGEIQNLTSDMTQLQSEYNQTYNLFISVSRNASIFRMDLDNAVFENEQLKGDVGMLQVYIFVAIMITAFIVFVYNGLKKWLKHEIPTKREAEQDTGHSKEAGIANCIVGIKKRIFKDEKASNQSNSRTMEEIHGKIDQLELNHDSFQKSAVQDIQNIRDRVGKLEAKEKPTV